MAISDILTRARWRPLEVAGRGVLEVDLVEELEGHGVFLGLLRGVGLVPARARPRARVVRVAVSGRGRRGRTFSRRVPEAARVRPGPRARANQPSVAERELLDARERDGALDGVRLVRERGDAVRAEDRQPRPRVVGDGPAYISFDVDGLDPVYAPGTGTPEVGGITTVEAQKLLRGLGGLNLVGGDVVEVAPPFDPTGNTALVGATMMFEILCLLAGTVRTRG